MDIQIPRPREVRVSYIEKTLVEKEVFIPVDDPMTAVEYLEDQYQGIEDKEFFLIQAQNVVRR